MSEIQNNWQELDQSPEFLENFLMQLRVCIMSKKFGENFMADYYRTAISKGAEASAKFENAHDRVDEAIDQAEEAAIRQEYNTALQKFIEASQGHKEAAQELKEAFDVIPEIDKIFWELKKQDTLEKLFAYSKSMGIELSEQEINDLKKDTIEDLIDDKNK